MTTSTIQPGDITTQLARTPGAALHRQLFVILREQIFRGLYQPGEKIPNEEALCAQFDVSRITVRRAVADLEASGLLQKRPGLGTFVTADVRPTRPSATLNFIDSMRKTQSETQTEVIVVENAAPPADIAEQLDLLSGAQCVHAIRLRRSADTVVMVTEAWVRGAAGAGITRQALLKHPLFDILAAHGIRSGRVIQEITAVAANAFHSERLDVEIGSPLIKVSRLLYDTERRPVLHLNIYMTPERSRFLMDFSIDEMNTMAAGSIFHDLARNTKNGAARASRSRRRHRSTSVISAPTRR